MNRDEYMTFCKKRAHEYLDRGDIKNGITSMLSDLSQRSDTLIPARSPLNALAMLIMIENDLPGAQRFIDGFN